MSPLNSVQVEVAPATVAEAASQEAQPLLRLRWSLAGSQEPPVATPEQETDNGTEVGPEQGNVIVVEGSYGPPESDPIAQFNETSYRITQDLDNVFLEPVAYAYRDGLPGPIRDGLGNVVRNLSEPANFLNFLLQLKIGDAVETLGRFAINSTLGLGGLIDIAEKPGINLPYRRNGFANTLGYYGVEPGAYLYLPITGATTVRDLVGNSLDQLVLPTAIGAPFDTPEYAVPYFVISNLDARLEVDAELGVLDETVDPYAARRDTYLARRERDIALLKGEEPPAPPAILEELEEELEGAIEDENPDTLDESVSSSAIPPRPLATISITTVNPQSLTR
ncbi:MAG: VacJ family lipoprotein [Pseudomonadota bacterium]